MLHGTNESQTHQENQILHVQKQGAGPNKDTMGAGDANLLVST